MKTTGAAGMGITFLSSAVPVFGKNAPSNQLNIAVMGVNGRGAAHVSEILKIDGMNLAYICDVDQNVLDKSLAWVKESNLQKKQPKGVIDFREALDDKDVDALLIAAPDHWHTPATLMALDAGKHVYVEKPCGHNPREGEMLLEALKRYDKVVQMGNQQRSAPESIEVIKEIKNGIIGNPYFAKCWYANKRGPIGNGKKAPVPEGLDYELWQGPAPRTPYQDNLIHYNWHWFWNWGTGEACNNGTHEIDVCRWALGVDFPIRVGSQGGRYSYDDDWEFYDTQVVTYDFDDEKSITWEGRSCNPRGVEGRGRGSAIYGTEGTVILDRDGYEIYDMDNKLVKEGKADSKAASMDTRGGDNMTNLHIVNFRDGVVDGAELNSPITEGHKSVLLCHLANISQKMGRTLQTDPKNGHIKNDDEAMKMWGREYEPGWEPDMKALGMTNE
uniref:Gfo/Idh/MocA family oxidoreductase n=1 Tax=Roseihalotalea indica TaxID=2867963 RepID=A0AA49GLU7_9BACT|nr:Gfo/Idh/MocA family oxidoreductase [Tunicatimonas sp. TK19036]